MLRLQIATNNSSWCVACLLYTLNVRLSKFRRQANDFVSVGDEGVRQISRDEHTWWGEWWFRKRHAQACKFLWGARTGRASACAKKRRVILYTVCFHDGMEGLSAGYWYYSRQIGYLKTRGRWRGDEILSSMGGCGPQYDEAKRLSRMKRLFHESSICYVERCRGTQFVRVMCWHQHDRAVVMEGKSRCERFCFHRLQCTVRLRRAWWVTSRTDHCLQFVDVQ